MNEMQELARRAFDNDALCALLKGEEPYTCRPDRFLPADVPVDWDRLLRTGVLPCCLQDATGERWAQLDQAILKLIQGGPLDVWCAYNVYFYLCYAAQGNRKALPVLERFPVEQLRAALKGQQLTLAFRREWTGKNDPAGLWGDILSADAALNARYQMGVLKR